MMTNYRDERTRRTVFVFRCHGSVEEVPIDDENVRRRDFADALKMFRPFVKEAGIRRSQVPGVATAPTPDRPSRNIQKLMDDIREGNLLPSQALEIAEAAGAMGPKSPPPRPKPKPSTDLLLPSTKPRIITLED